MPTPPLFTRSIPPASPPRFVGEAEELYGTLGYKGELFGGLSYDLSDRSAATRSTCRCTARSTLPTAPQTQTSFKFGKITQEEANANLDLSYPLEVGLASPVTISGGGEYRKETYKLVAGDVQSYGAGPYAAPQRLYTLVSPGVYTAAGTTARAVARPQAATAARVPRRRARSARTAMPPISTSKPI